MTQAADKGLIVGKTYTLTGPTKFVAGEHASLGIAVGDKLMFTSDDNSHLPYFKKVDKDGNVTGNQLLVNINRCTLVEVLPTPVTPVTTVPYEVTVRSNDESTLFFVTRVLSKQEIAAVFALLNK